ncbi:redoxin family protein [Cyclobacterium salsum]|uniref:redoxin family protein n=1 Tax=Cyclobacterium salsum TaxID=2666329 RepID=UPI0013916052|nr:redoxin family protein [Cyclobacterium salsum]
MRRFGCFLVYFFCVSLVWGQEMAHIELIDAYSGQPVSISEQSSATTMVFIVTSLNCPYARLYEERILDLHRQYSGENVFFALVNPHSWMEEENQQRMQQLTWARDAGIPFLMDSEQEFTRQTGVRKIPEAVVISSGPTGYSIAYKGAIDNNAQSPASVSVQYLDNAIEAILSRKRPGPAVTRAVGCNIRSML